MKSESVTIPASAIPEIRRMLNIGLYCLGEVERLQMYAEIRDETGNPLPEIWRARHPTGAHETGNFASALLMLDAVENDD